MSQLISNRVHLFLSPPTATFMPNTFDQFGQPIVMMPYPAPPNAADGSVPFETSDVLSPEAESNSAEGEVAAGDLPLLQGEEVLAAETTELSQDQLEIPENEIIEPQLEQVLSNKLQAIPAEGEMKEQEEQAEEQSPAECPPEIEGEQVNNTMPLDPASTSFYPQSQSMYPYYPMVFTPQQLPPNTSIIPLAGE